MNLDFLSQIPSNIIDFKITIGNILTIVVGIASLTGIYFKTKYDVSNLKDKDDKQELDISELKNKVEKMDTQGSTVFLAQKEFWNKEVATYNDKFSKIDEMSQKLERIAVQFEFLMKWIEKQERKEVRDN